MGGAWWGRVEASRMAKVQKARAVALSGLTHCRVDLCEEIEIRSNHLFWL